jgi:hypothetical protein
MRQVGSFRTTSVRFFAFDTGSGLRMFPGELSYRARDICPGRQPVRVQSEKISQLRRRICIVQIQGAADINNSTHALSE